VDEISKKGNFDRLHNKLKIEILQIPINSGKFRKIQIKSYKIRKIQENSNKFI
jgi:hypothetical protein